jgi:phage-related protein
MPPEGKELFILSGTIKTPPFSSRARAEAGYYLRQLQQGHTLSLPISRPMPNIGKRCHELRINDNNQTWRIIYRIDDDSIIILEIFSKKTKATPDHIKKMCQNRLKQYDQITKGESQ